MGKEEWKLRVPSFSARSFVKTNVTGSRRRFSRTRRLTNTQAAFPGTCSRQIAQENCAFDIPALSRAAQQNVSQQVARKGEVSSTFRKVGRQYAACDIVTTATCLATSRSMLRGTLLFPPTPTPHPHASLPHSPGGRLRLKTAAIFFPQGLPSPLVLVGIPEFPLTDECVFLPAAVCTTSAERGLVLCEDPASNQLNNSGNWTLKDQLGQWRQLNLSHITNITAIGTQAGHLQLAWWKKQNLLYSSCDGEYWQPYEKVRGIFHVFSRHCCIQQSTHQK